MKCNVINNERLNNIEKEKEELRKKLIHYENENNKLTFSKNNLDFEIDSFKKENKDLQNKQTNLKSQLETKEKEINDLKGKLSKANNIINKNNKNDQKIKQLNNDLNKEKNINLDLRKQIEQLKNEIENYRKNDYNEEFIGNSLDHFYDIVINIKSIRALADENEGWPIKWNQNSYESVKDFLKNEKILRVGILGNGNVGKSFLLSRIFNEIIPSGFNVITEGISIKINKESHYALFDSAGLQTPLINKEKMCNNSLDNEKEYHQYLSLYKDKTQTENFIQNLILCLSDMILVVVGKISFNEQRLINNIKNEISNQKKNKKKIFIIHNLSNFQKKKQVEEHIEQTLLNSASFTLDKVDDIQKKGKYYYIEKNSINNKENDYYVYHLIMAREGTEAGNYYNNYLYELLRERINDFPQREPLNILNEIKNKFFEWQNALLEYPIEEEKLIIENDGKQEKRFIYLYNKENNDANRDKTKANKKNPLIPKACLNDELGFVIYRSSEYEPSYSMYIENGNLIVKIEALGNITIEKVYADIDLNQIFIKGNKEKDRDIYLINNNKELNSNSTGYYTPKSKGIVLLKETRKFGNFNLVISYGNQIKLAGELPIEEENEKEKKLEEGIKIFKFPLVKRRQTNN